METFFNVHPAALRFQTLDEESFRLLKEDIAARGVLEPIKYRIKNGKRELLDGRNRLAVCRELGIACPSCRVRLKDEEVEDFIFSLNLHRRHIKPIALDRLRRIARVVAARQEGKTTTAIAKVEGVSQTLICDDLRLVQKTDPQLAATFPVKIKGLDGRLQAARHKETKRAKRYAQNLLSPDRITKLALVGGRLKLIMSGDEYVLSISEAQHLYARLGKLLARAS